MTANPTHDMSDRADDGSVLKKKVDRRRALSVLFGGMAAGAQVVNACSPLNAATRDERELKGLEWKEFFQKHYRRMTPAERAETVARLERLAELRHGEKVNIDTTDAQPGVVFGYA